MTSPPDELSFRLYSAERDRADCLRVWREASRVGHPFLGEADLDAQERLVGEHYLAQAETWIAERDGRVLGFIGLLGSFIGGLFVDPAAHGQGVGRALVRHAASLRGALEVDVYEADTACAFYRRLGFVEQSRRETDDEGRPLPILRMRWAG